MGDIIKDVLEGTLNILTGVDPRDVPGADYDMLEKHFSNCRAALAKYEDLLKCVAELGADNKVFHGALKYIAAQACSKAEPAESILAVIRANAEFALKREQQALMQAAKGQVFATLNKEDE